MTNYYGSMSESGIMLQSTPVAADLVRTSFLLNHWRECAMLISAVFNGMSAGIMFIFSNTIMPALGQLSDEAGIEAMVKINDVILNPFFKLLFVGGLISTVPVADMFFFSKNQPKPARYYALASTIVYFLGQIVITATQNIPRNNALMALDAASQAASYYWRNEYLTKWVSWNTGRAVFSTIASILGVLSLRFMVRKEANR
jgi:uncharacterized membrane protein